MYQRVISRQVRRIIVLVLSAGFTTASLLAHEGVGEQIASISSRIKSTPDAPDLYVRRAELHREARHWTEALADLDRAAKLNSRLSSIDLVRAHVLLDSGQPAKAIDSASSFLERQPEHVGALTIRARARAALKETTEADRDFARALAVHPLPELFIERSQMLAAAGVPDRALQALDDGVVRLGPLVTLELEAITLNVQSKHYDEALARIDSVASQTPRKETWLARRGEILEKAGRQAEARRAYQAALDALALLPSWTRATASSVSLRTRLETDIRRVSRRMATSHQDHQ